MGFSGFPTKTRPPFMYTPKLLLICPSRGRSARIGTWLKAARATTSIDHTDIVILLDLDDPELEEYKSVLKWQGINHLVFDRSESQTLTTEIINQAFDIFGDYAYYSVTNDDIIYQTSGWDIALSQPLKISSGQDDTMVEKYGERFIGNVDPGSFPITSVIDGDIVRAVGWLQYPELRHSCGDNIWFWIGKRADCLYHDPGYHTVHNSPYFDKAEVDDTFKRSNANDNMQDYYTYKEWLKYKCGTEVIKVMKLIDEREAVTC